MSDQENRSDTKEAELLGVRKNSLKRVRAFKIEFK